MLAAPPGIGISGPALLKWVPIGVTPAEPATIT
jgi:hypothetical protein